MTRITYESVTLGILLAIVIAVSLYRYSTERAQFHYATSYSQTTTLHTVQLDPEPETRLNINCATHTELAALPGISSNIAAEIIAYREEQPFAHIAEVIRIHGIGKKRLITLTEHVWCGPPENHNE